MEESCVGHDYNLQSKGTPKSNDSPSTSKIVAKNTPTTVAFNSKETSTNKSPDKEKENEKEETPSKSPINLGLTQKILGYLNLDYNVVEDFKKVKVNITVFELCKITQLREQLHEYLQHI